MNTDPVITKLIYPDPFEPAGLEVDLPDDALVTVTVTDDAGTIIHTVVNSVPMQKGRHTISLIGGVDRRGPLYCRLTAVIGSETVQVVKGL
ncbi:MAG: hypothetical protein M5R41_00845 [Bacteroidia bacterium]|nr:hypothetical protein [Bacteroidia bacterium]